MLLFLPVLFDFVSCPIFCARHRFSSYRRNPAWNCKMASAIVICTFVIYSDLDYFSLFRIFFFALPFSVIAFVFGYVLRLVSRFVLIDTVGSVRKLRGLLANACNIHLITYSRVIMRVGFTAWRVSWLLVPFSFLLPLVDVVVVVVASASCVSFLSLLLVAYYYVKWSPAMISSLSSIPLPKSNVNYYVSLSNNDDVDGTECLDYYMYYPYYFYRLYIYECMFDLYQSQIVSILM